MRIAEGLRVQQVRVLTHLRRAMQAGAGVVQVNLSVRIQPPVLSRAQRVERQRGSVLGMAREKLDVGVGLGTLVHGLLAVAFGLPATGYRLPADPDVIVLTGAVYSE